MHRSHKPNVGGKVLPTSSAMATLGQWLLRILLPGWKTSHRGRQPQLHMLP